MKDSYYEVANGICTMNFAYEQDGVTCYPDLVKVGVALDTGSVVFFDARGYLMNHQEREFSAPMLTDTTAREILSPSLTVQSQNMAVIPTSGMNEAYCYEFLCEGREGRRSWSISRPDRCGGTGADPHRIG